MDYIIDPMFFYWASLSDKLAGAMSAFAIFPLGIGLFFAIDRISEGAYDDSKSVWKNFKREIVAIAFGFFLLIGRVFVPSEETLIKMQLAKLGTTDNADKVLQMIDEKADKLIEAVGKDK